MARGWNVMAVLVLLAVPALAEDPAAPPPPSPSPSPNATPSPAPSPRLAVPYGLKLGEYSTLAPRPEDLVVPGPEVPRFETEVEVRARAMDSLALTAKLAWWLRDFDGTRGPISGAGRAPTLAEMRDFRPHPADSLDLNALVGWLVGKVNEKRKN